MFRNASYAIAAAALVGALGCTSSSDGSSGAALTSEGTTMCPMFLSTVECLGDTIAEVNVSNDDTDLVIRVHGPGDFLIAGVDVHAGLGFPATAGGDFDIPAFPYHFDYTTPLATATIRIPLADIGATCGATLSMAIHVRAVRLDSSGAVIDTKEGFVQSGHAFGSGYCFYYDVCCHVPEPDAGVPEIPEHDAGMPDEDDACTYTQGFYKNRPGEWPVTSLVIAGETYTQAELLAILRTSVSGDMSIGLAHQLITAMLNVANGAPAPAEIAEAELFLAANADADGRLPFGFSGGTAEHREASRLNDALTAFNEGRAGTLHCDR